MFTFGCEGVKIKWRRRNRPERNLLSLGDNGVLARQGAEGKVAVVGNGFLMRVSRKDRNTVLIRIGTEVKGRRQHLGISQGALAGKPGVHVNVIGRTERGKYDPTVLTLDAIAAALNTSMVELLRAAPK